MLRWRTTLRARVSITAIAIAAGTMSVLQPAAGQTSNFFPLNGSLRDFRRTDLNFAVTPVGGNGMYAGNLATTLGADERPLFIGGGGRVDLQWMDQDGHAIAPNMMIDSSSAGGGSVLLVEAPEIRNHPVIDTYDPGAGPYSILTAGPAPTFLTGSTMPEVIEPALVDAAVGLSRAYGHSKTVLLDYDIQCEDLCIGNNMTLQVSGAVTILCEGEFRVRNQAHIEMLEGSSLTVYARDGISIENSARVNMNTGDSSLVMLCNMGQNEVLISNTAQACARIVSPAGVLRMKNGAQFYGRFTGYSIEIRNDAGLHVEAGMTICGREPNDVAGAYSQLSSGGIPSPMAFSTWFADVPASNVTLPYTITLQRAFNGTMWQYNTAVFYPVDSLGFGNQGQIHNNYFTFSSKIRFTHHACGGSFFEYLGTDDAWLFVNGKLAIDHGGVRMPAVPQYVDMDRLGLTDGQEYVMHLFIVERNSVASAVRIRTNADLISATAN